jgi:hypothetical protein
MRASAPTGYGGGIMSKPRAFTCYLCGQQYGRASLLIHIGKAKQFSMHCNGQSWPCCQ